MVDIAPSTGTTLRWRRFDGTTGALAKGANGTWTSTFGWTQRADGKEVSFSDCTHGEIIFAGTRGKRIAFDVSDTEFQGHDVKLVGRLAMPKGKGKVPIVVLVHGSEHDSAREFYALQRMLPAQGVGAFVYDKRGTGGSGGSYSQDFNLLADDAIAAMREAKHLAGARAGRIGYQGGSQGGWVVPIAANRAPVDFAIISFGLAVSVIDEDQQQIEVEMRDKGYSPAIIAKAQEVGRAAGNLIAGGTIAELQKFDAVRAKYKNEPWYKDVHGNFTYMLLPYNEAQLRELKKKYDWGTPWRYDPMPTLRANTTPQLWILGERDYEAPSAETSRLIKGLIADGKPFTLALYPGAEHGMTLFEMNKKGERVSTRYAPAYFKMMRDFARDGRLSHAYGNAQITRAKTDAH